MIFLSFKLFLVSQRLVRYTPPVDRCVASSQRFAASMSKRAVGLLVTMLLLSSAVGYGQAPGTLPPPGFLQDTTPWPEQLEGIRPDAFLFQDESNTPVVMPRMSFEEIDRLRRLDRGGRSGDQIATLERLFLAGTMGPARAQWNAELAVRLDGAAVRETVGRSVIVDIGFAGAHLLQAADVRFVPAANAQRDASLMDQAIQDLATPDAGANGEPVTGAYVRLAPRQTLEQTAAGLYSSVPVPSSNTGVVSGAPTDLSSRPTTFPTVLHQAMGVEGDGFSRRDGGYQLVLPIDSLLEKFLSPRTSLVVKVHLQLSARVWMTPPGQSWLPLSLPAVSTLIQLELDDANNDGDIALLDVVGSGREVTRRLEGSDRYTVECDGGVIALRVSGAAEGEGDTGDLLEVESETQLQWESPTEPPTMDVRLVTKNLRGPLRGCEIRLPASAVLVSPPEIVSASSESRDTSGAANGTSDSAWWEVVISRADGGELSSWDQNPGTNAAASSDEEDATQIVVRWIGTEQMQAPSSVRLRLQMRQFPSDATATDPWVLRIPQVTDAIGHRGQVTIRTAADHRLRWRPRMGIDAVVAAQTNSSNGDLVYPFRFTQTRFELPIWLSRKQQQIRLSADAELSVTRRAARVRLDVRAGGVGIDPKGLRLELGPWQLIGIQTDIASTELEVTSNDGSVEWQVDTSDGNWPTSYQISAELLATANAPPLDSLTLPRLVSTDSATVLRDVRLALADDHREAWLVDLAGSPALQRIPGQNESKFRFLIPESPWSLHGSFATRPLELKWSGAVTTAQSADRWVIRSQWTITSQLDLEGRLKFAVPALGNLASPETSIPPTSASAASPSGAEPTHPSSSDEISTDAGVKAAASTVPRHGEAPLRWTAMVDGSPASVRGPLAEPTSESEFADHHIYEIISPELATGTQQVELVLEQRILPVTPTDDSPSDDSVSVDQGEIHGLLAVPIPVADRIDLPAPLKITMPLGVVDSAGVFWRVLADMEGSLGDFAETGGFQLSPTNAQHLDSTPNSTDASNWTFKIIPDFPIPIVLRSRLGEEKLTEIPRAYLRSLVGKHFRHEHLMATVRGGRRVRLGLPASLQTIRVEVQLDGAPAASTRDATGIRIDLPETSQSAHLLDVRIWVEEQNNPWTSHTKPLIRLPVGSGLQYWQLVVPTDSHLFWASNQSGRAMRWKRDGLNLSRVPTVSDTDLTRWALDLDWQFGDNTTTDTTKSAADGSPGAAVASASDGKTLDSEEDSSASDGVSDAILQVAMRESLSNATFAVPGNRYLFFAGNVLSFAAITVSRTVLWLAIGGLVLLLAAAAQWFPGLHQSLMAFVLAIALAGLLIIAPDGIVLTAQLVIISLTLVAVFYAISAIAVPRDGQRALPPRSSSRDSVVVPGGSSKRERVVSTQAAAPPKSADLASPDATDDQQETQTYDAGTSPEHMEDISLMPSTNPAAQARSGSDSDGSSEKQSAAPPDALHTTDSRSDSDSSEAVR